MKIDYYNLDFIHPDLKKLVSKVSEMLPEEPVVTSLYRIKDPGVHGTLPLRGTDLRCHDKKIGRLIEKTINRTCIYDPERPNMKCVIYHDTGKGWHLHCQVHPRTKFNKL